MKGTSLTWAVLAAIMVHCRIAEATQASSGGSAAKATVAAEGAGYSECAMQKDLSTIISLGVGLLGSFVIAQLTGVQRQSEGDEAAQALLSFHLMML
eukprot:CAMPEP_0172708858 /NCGR_PEP_ID=MMETSP1074-20121228/52487_1 /TAXON_ID=2916 /ORGANISM="Ceratium fusus, Strain PA161109" /LENGTH=96 /DNA_ID=CAMNT_0013531929 /DNA_START=68 /DNA_END=358 /DNA_ORIENTATION=-